MLLHEEVMCISLFHDVNNSLRQAGLRASPRQNTHVTAFTASRHDGPLRQRAHTACHAAASSSGKGWQQGVRPRRQPDAGSRAGRGPGGHGMSRMNQPDSYRLAPGTQAQAAGQAQGRARTGRRA